VNFATRYAERLSPDALSTRQAVGVPDVEHPPGRAGNPGLQQRVVVDVDVPRLSGGAHRPEVNRAICASVDQPAAQNPPGRGAGGSKRHRNGTKGLPKFQISRTELSASAGVASEDGIRCAAASLTYHVAGPWFRG
jgi:hypothetical protein